MKTLLGRALTWILVFAFGLAPCLAAAQDAGAPPPNGALSPEQLEQLVAPVALYPDALLSQVLMASTYPLAIVEADRWMQANPNVTGGALENAMQQQTWDPSVKSLVAVPQTLQMMSDKIEWTQKLGDAFLAQQKDVLDAVQRLRARADAAGNLASNQQQIVTTESDPSSATTPTIIKIVQADPQVIYVPTYNPTVVYGAWPYPAYPPYYYYPPGYVWGASIISFGVGFVVGAAIWGGCNWHSGSVNINVNNYNHYNHTTINNSNWTHNSVNRQGVPYRNASTAQRYGGMSDAQAAQARANFRGHGDQAFNGTNGNRGGEGYRGGAGNGSGNRTNNPPPNRGNVGGAAERAGGVDRGSAGAAGTRPSNSAARDTGGAHGGTFSQMGPGGSTRETGGARGGTSSQVGTGSGTRETGGARGGTSSQVGPGSGTRDTGGARGGTFSQVGSGSGTAGSRPPSGAAAANSAPNPRGGAYANMGNGGEARTYSNRGGQSLSAGGFKGGGGGGAPRGGGGGGSAPRGGGGGGGGGGSRGGGGGGKR